MQLKLSFSQAPEERLGPWPIWALLRLSWDKLGHTWTWGPWVSLVAPMLAKRKQGEGWEKGQRISCHRTPSPPYTKGSQAPNTPKSLPVAAAPPSGPGHPAARQREPDPRHIWFWWLNAHPCGSGLSFPEQLRPPFHLLPPQGREAGLLSTENVLSIMFTVKWNHNHPLVQENGNQSQWSWDSVKTHHFLLPTPPPTLARTSYHFGTHHCL